MRGWVARDFFLIARNSFHESIGTQSGRTKALAPLVFLDLVSSGESQKTSTAIDFLDAPALGLQAHLPLPESLKY